MNSYLHIGVGDSAVGCLRHCLKENKDNIYFGNVINFRDDLSTGSIYKLDENINQRVLWLEELYGKTGIEEEYYIENNKDLKREDIYSEIKNNYIDTLEISKDFKVVIWHGNNVIEQVVLRYLINRFKGYELYEADVSKYITHVYNNEEYKVRCVAECSPKDLETMLDKIFFVEDNKREQFINDWNEFKDSKATLKVLQDGKIVSVKEDYYDKEILSSISNQFQKAARVVGTVLGTCGQTVSDTFIDYRLRILIESGDIQYRGELKAMRDFEVKIKDKI